MKKERLKIRTVRVEFFSDAVIAIIITLMVLDIHLPKLEDNATSAQIFHQLKGILPNIFAFIISFATLGVYWANHHQFYQAVEYTDWKLLYYNLHFLFWCSLIPLSTALLAENYDKPAITLLYGFHMLATGGAFGLMHAHAIRNGLFTKNISPKIFRQIKRVNILSFSLYLIATFVGYVSVYISIAIYAFVPTLYFFPRNVEFEIDETS
jgi:uncharacterized membrane protein